jgi:hypothetical protein
MNSRKNNFVAITLIARKIYRNENIKQVKSVLNLLYVNQE